jgi:NitT/TauT family transport system permease protein
MNAAPALENTHGGRLPAPLLPWVGVAIFVAAWWLATDVLHPNGFAARFALSRSLTSLESLLLSGEIFPHLAASMGRIFVGLALSIVLGLPLGVALGAFPRFGMASAPLLHFFRMVSPLSWTPLAIMLFGIGAAPVCFLVAAAGMWPIVVATSAAVSSMDRRLTLVGRSLGGSPFEVARTIVWPHVRPQVATGIRLSIGLGWVVLVPAEMLGVDSGLGYMVLSTRDRLDYPGLVATIVIIGVVGVSIDKLARWCLS